MSTGFIWEIFKFLDLFFRVRASKQAANVVEPSGISLPSNSTTSYSSSSSSSSSTMASLASATKSWSRNKPVKPLFHDASLPQGWRRQVKTANLLCVLLLAHMLTDRYRWWWGREGSQRGSMMSTSTVPREWSSGDSTFKSDSGKWITWMLMLSRSNKEVQWYLTRHGITDIDPESISFKVEGPATSRLWSLHDF